MKARFSDDSVIESSRCMLPHQGNCSGELSAMWWFRMNRLKTQPKPVGYDTNKVIVCKAHGDEIWGRIKSLVNIGLDHFEMGIEEEIAA